MSAETKQLRVFTGGIAHETHSFSSVPTDEAAFRAYEWSEGDEIFSVYRGTRTSLGGVIDGAEANGITLVPGFYTFAMPSGVVPRSDFEGLAERLYESLGAASMSGKLDGVILVCHGAMLADGHDDVEGELAERVRAIVGSDTPIVMTLDYHANISARLASEANVLLGYDTYPHVDVYERGFEATDVLKQMQSSSKPVTTAFVSIPILAVPQRQGTDDQPMVDLMARAHAFEEDPRVLAVTLAGGFCYTDAPRTGMAAVVSTFGEPELAQTMANELRELAWARRDEFLQENLPVKEAVHRASIAALRRPSILVDMADNIGGGAPGDGTALLAEIIEQHVTGFAIVIADPAAVADAFAAGVGGDFDSLVGGKTDRFHGEPVRVQGRVRLLSDGRFIYRGSYMTGQVREMGRTAVIDAGGNHVILTERKTMPFDDEQLRSVGVTPEACRAIVVKSATAWRAAYADIAGEVFEVDCPGICTADLATLPFAHLTRPIYPLDPDMTLPG